MRKFLYRLFAVPGLLPALSASAEEQDTVGGQALIEGVMMRGKGRIAWAVRRPGGDAVVESHPFVSVTKRSKFWGLPVVRGVINLFESLSWGYRALARSADIAVEEESADAKPVPVDGQAGKQAAPPNKKPTLIDQALAAVTFIVPLGISVALFMYAPMLAAERIPGVKDSPILFNLLAGGIRITLFLIYISLISLWSEMRRVFEYHGAEHKAIFAFEDGKPLTVDNIEPYATVHPRCGTSFLILVAICSILLFSLIDALYIHHFGNFINLPHRFAVHLVLIPLVAGTSYEFLKLSDRYKRFPVVGFLIKPGLWLQRITTRKPDASQIEIAVKALEAAL